MQTPDEPARAYVGLGGNLGDPVVLLRAGVASLGRLPGTRLVATSAFYRSAPVGLTDQPDFINCVCALDTRLPPRELMRAMLEIEAAHGRVRSVPGGPRTLDLDLLLYGDLICDEPGLTLPHPRLHERAFVLVPLLDLSPGLAIPGRGSVADLSRALPAQRIERLEDA
jgi:2-amino-4-hydroxy-6-hydroxymethyldihydropteridine diphosphokinase